jgi:hypothetical protein
MHDFHMGDIAIGESYEIHLIFTDKISELGLWIDGNALGIELAAKLCRIESSFYPWNLCSGESNDLVARIVPDAAVKATTW